MKVDLDHITGSQIGCENAHKGAQNSKHDRKENIATSAKQSYFYLNVFLVFFFCFHE